MGTDDRGRTYPSTFSISISIYYLLLLSSIFYLLSSIFYENGPGGLPVSYLRKMQVARLIYRQGPNAKLVELVESVELVPKFMKSLLHPI